MQDVENTKMHLREHQKFPATTDELIAECDSLSDFSQADKEWFAGHLPKREKPYNSADEVIGALGL